MTELKKDYCADGKSYYQGGVFFPDQTPLEIPLGYQIPETLESMIARMVHNEQIYNSNEVDNVDEADDFDVMDEDPILASKHEFTEMQEETYTKEKREAQQAVDDAKRELDKPEPVQAQTAVSEAEVVEQPPVPVQPKGKRTNPPKGGQ